MANLKDTVINDTGALRLPKGTTAERPTSPENGYIRLNTSTGIVEVYANGNWRPAGIVPKDGSVPEKAATFTSDLDSAGVTQTGNYYLSPPGFTGTAELVHCEQVNGIMHMRFTLDNTSDNYIWASKSSSMASSYNSRIPNVDPTGIGYGHWNQISDLFDAEQDHYITDPGDNVNDINVTYKNPNTGQTYSDNFIVAVIKFAKSSPDLFMSHTEDNDAPGCSQNSEAYIEDTTGQEFRVTAHSNSGDFRIRKFELNNGNVTQVFNNSVRSESNLPNKEYFMPLRYNLRDVSGGCSGLASTWGWGWNNQVTRIAS